MDGRRQAASIRRTVKAVEVAVPVGEELGNPDEPMEAEWAWTWSWSRRGG
jgi:hypothetical protein